MNSIKHFIPPHEVKNFITLPGEELILAQRKHWVVILGPILSMLLVILVVESGLFAVLHLYFSLWSLFIAISLLIISIVMSYILRVIISWYCQMYIITNKRIMEICHIPFSSYHVNALLLDQMRVVEVDIDVGNMFNQMVGKGDVIIVLDQYAHDHSFTLQDVADPRRSDMYLTQAFGASMQNNVFVQQYRARPKFI